MGLPTPPTYTESPQESINMADNDKTPRAPRAADSTRTAKQVAAKVRRLAAQMSEALADARVANICVDLKVGTRGDGQFYVCDDAFDVEVVNVTAEVTL